jgi:regulator of sigma E protease
MISTVLAFIFTLALLVVVHEYGHYRVAVACGVKVLRLAIGWLRADVGRAGRQRGRD